MNKFKVYDSVWMMSENTPIEQKVFAVVESMDYLKTGTEFRYHVVNSQLGAGWGNNEGVIRSGDVLFASKEELLKSL